MSNQPPHQFAAAAAVQVSSSVNRDDYHLVIRQKPVHAKVAIGKEKDRKPIDPPPVVQLLINRALDPDQGFLQSPYFFMSANLLPGNDGEAGTALGPSSLSGSLVSSLHRLKDCEGIDAGFFVFSDLSVKVEGRFRLQFNLFEMRPATSLPTDPPITTPEPLSQNLISNQMEVCSLASIISEEFEVSPAKTWPGMGESTPLTKTFSDQGVRLRLRKEPRTLLRKRGPASDDYERMSYKKRDSGDAASSSIKRRDSPVGGLQRNERAGASPLFPNPYHSSQNNRPDISHAGSLSGSLDNGNMTTSTFNPRFQTTIARLPSHPVSPMSMPRAEEFERNLARRGSNLSQLRQASSDSSLNSHGHSQAPQNPFQATGQYSMPSSNRTSMSDYSGAYTHQPPSQQQTQVTGPFQYGPHHNYSRSQTSINSQSPATNRGTPHSFYNIQGPREMAEGNLTSPFETSDAERRDSFMHWTGSEGSDDRLNFAQRNRDSTNPALFSNTSPFNGPRNSSGNYGGGRMNSRTISPTQTHGLGISGTGVYDSSPTFMPPPGFGQSHNTQFPPPSTAGASLDNSTPGGAPDSAGTGVVESSFYKP